MLDVKYWKAPQCSRNLGTIIKDPSLFVGDTKKVLARCELPLILVSVFHWCNLLFYKKILEK